MAKAKNTWKLVLTSVVLSILILAAFTAVFINLIVPSYNISREQIYTVLTRALPILIGLLFIEIAVVSSSHSEFSSFKDNIDKLSPNAYDAPLYTEPVDDPLSPRGPSGNEYNTQKTETVIKEVVKEVPVEVIKEVVKEVPVEVVREVPVEVEVIKEVPVEVVKEVVKEVPVEVIREVEVPVIKEGELVIKQNYTPVEIKIHDEVVVEKPVEVVVEKEVPVEKQVPAEEEVYLTLHDALEEEIREAQSVGYPLTLVAISGNEEEKLSSVFDSPSFFDNGNTYTILPYTRKKDILRKAKVAEASVLEMDAKSTADSMLKAVL